MPTAPFVHRRRRRSGSSPPPAPAPKRLSPDHDRHSYFASYIPRSLYTAHEPLHPLSSPIHPYQRKAKDSGDRTVDIVGNDDPMVVVYQKEPACRRRVSVSDRIDKTIDRDELSGGSNGDGDNCSIERGEVVVDRINDLNDKEESVSGVTGGDAPSGERELTSGTGGEELLCDPKELCDGGGLRSGEGIGDWIGALSGCEDNGFGLLSGESMTGDQTDAMFEWKVLCGGDIEGCVEGGGDGLSDGKELVGGQKGDGLSDCQGMIGEKWSDDEGGDGGWLGRVEVIGILSDKKCDFEDLVSGRSGNVVEECGNGLGRGESACDQNNGFCNQGVLPGQSGDVNGGRLARDELVKDQIIEWNDEMALGQGNCSIDHETDGEGDALETQELVNGETDESCCLNELANGMSFCNIENGGGMDGEELDSARIRDLCYGRDLVNRKDVEDHMKANSYFDRSERGELVKDRIVELYERKEITGVKRSNDAGSGDCIFEGNQLGIKMEMPEENIKDFGSDLDSLRLNLLQEIERRREAESSLAHLQKQVKNIEAYFTLAGLKFPTMSEGQNLQLDDCSMMQECKFDCTIKEVDTKTFERYSSQVEDEASKELLIESKDNEIAQLHEKLKYVESINQELIQTNMEVAAISFKRKRSRKRRQKLIWTCIAFSATIGVSVATYSFLPAATSSLPSLYLSNYS